MIGKYFEYMKKDMKKKFNVLWWRSILTSVLFFVFGLLLVMKPEVAVNTIGIALGVVILAIGLLISSAFIKNKEDNVSLVLGLVIAVVGFVFIINPTGIANIIPIMIGLFLILNSLNKLTYSFVINDNNKRLISIVLGFITLIIGLLLIINPFKGVEAITIIIGTMIMVYSFTEIINDFIRKFSLKAYVKEVKKEFEDDNKAETKVKAKKVIKAKQGTVKEKDNKKNKK